MENVDEIKKNSVKFPKKDLKKYLSGYSDLKIIAFCDKLIFVESY